MQTTDSGAKRFCLYCGREIMPDTVICPNCGCTNAVKSPERSESRRLARCAMIFAFLLPVVGLILGIIGVCTYQSSSHKSTCGFAIAIAVVTMIVYSVLVSVLFAL